ncbi:MAG: putative Fe-S cluster assembly protein SufT [Gammaproteobacteria bacterium]
MRPYLQNNEIKVDEAITVERDCDAILIPQGTPINLPVGSVVFITQALGTSCTVNINGNLARVEGKDLDALGFEPFETIIGTEMVGDGRVEEGLLWEQMNSCYDPEIPVSIVELGLIYDCKVEPVEVEGKQIGNKVNVIMTLTAAGCGMGDILVHDVKTKLETVPNVTEVHVEMVFDPPWNQSMMTDAAKLQMGLF